MYSCRTDMTSVCDRTDCNRINGGGEMEGNETERGKGQGGSINWFSC